MLYASHNTGLIPLYSNRVTSFGINNEGQLVLDYYHEDTDQLGDANVYNGQNSVLWTNFRQAFPDEIKATYQELRNSGKITYDKLVDQFITNGSDKWSESIYNEDMDFKYISMLRSDNDATNLPQVRGSGEEHFRYFVENRLNYCDSKWYASDYANDYISLRIYTPNTWAGIEPNPAITVTPFSDMYAGVRYKANGTLYQERVTHGESVTFSPQGETFESENNETFNDTETAVYGAHQLSSIGDLAPLYCGSVNVSSADKLIELKVGDGTTGYSNANLRELSVGTNKLLKKIDVQNCPNFESVLDLSNCPSIEEVYAKGSSITGVSFPGAGILKIAQLPGTVTNITLKNQLEIETFTLESYANVKTLWVENCPTINVQALLASCTNVERVRLTDIDWTYDTAAELKALAAKGLKGIDENGTNIDQMWIDGKCHIKSLTGTEYLQIQEAFPYVEITYDTLTSLLIFMDEGGTTELYRQTIQNGGDGTYGGPTPTKESTAQYDFTHSGWSLTPGGPADPNALKGVTADRTVYATFSNTLRSYTVRFYNGTTLLEAYTVQYGGTATYKGSTPVNNSTGNPADFEFYGWKPSPTNIQGDTNCYAQFHDMREITDSWATIAAACADGTATSKYAVGAFKQLDIGAVDLPYDFRNSDSVVYNGEIHIFGSGEQNYRKSHYKWDGTEWVSVSTLPHEFYGGRALVYNGEIHIFGGGYGFTNTTTHHKWTGTEWVSVSTLPHEAGGCVIVYNNELHILGSAANGYRNAHHRWTGTEWISVSTLPYNFYNSEAVVLNGEIHIFGSEESNYRKSHYKWNGTEWVSASTLPYEFYNGSAVVYNNEIHIFGSGFNNHRTKHYKWNGTEWVSVSTLPYTFTNGRTVIYNDAVHMLGGRDYLTNFYHYSAEDSKWSKYVTDSIPMQVVAHNHDELAADHKWEQVGVELPYSFYQSSSVILNNELHILGSGNSTYYKSHYKWNGTEWAEVSTLPYNFYQGASVVYNDEIHILGSNSNTSYTAHYKWNSTDGWVSVSTLPYNFNRGSAVTMSDGIHILGGDTDRTAHYKWDGTSWTEVSTLPYEFYFGNAIVYNDDIHILGGYISSTYTKHYKWNSTDGWTEVSTLPYSLSYGMPVIQNGELHILGSGNSTYYQSHYKWNGTEWVKDESLPYPGAYRGSACVYNNEIYIYGGANSGDYKKFYKFSGPTWEFIATPPFKIFQTPVVVYNNEIHALGTNHLSGMHQAHYKYDGNAWTDVSTLPFDGVNSSAVVYNNEIHILGSGNAANYTSHYKWNGTEWVSVSTLPYDFYQGAAVVYNNEIHIMSSYNTSYRKYHYKWDGTSWIEASTMPFAFNTPCVVIYNNEMHVVGSYNSTVHYKFDGTKWTEVSTLPYKTITSCCAVYNNEIHLLGGQQNRTSHYKWDGVKWSSASVLPGEYSHGCAVVYRGRLYLMGSFYNDGNPCVLSNPKATLTFVAGNLLSEDRAMNDVAVSDPSYVDMKLRAYLNTDFVSTLPSDLQISISEVIKYSAPDHATMHGVIMRSNEKCWLLSNDELGDMTDNINTGNISGEGSTYSCFTDNKSRICYKNDGVPYDYYMRTARRGGYNQFGIIDAKGRFVLNGSSPQSTIPKSIRIGFCI